MVGQAEGEGMRVVLYLQLYGDGEKSEDELRMRVTCQKARGLVAGSSVELQGQ